MDKVNQFKKELEKSNRTGIALDIDETLADSLTHWFEHMFRFHAPEGMDVARLIKNYKFVEEVPGWESPEAIAYMQTLLHSEEFNETIPLIEDANHVVNKINARTPIRAYITARPQTIAEATKRWLRSHGFPEAELLMRPADTRASKTDLTTRNKWKAEILVSLYPEIAGIIDDNKVLAHELQALDYQGTLYLYGTETNEFKDYAHVVVCPTWGSVLKSIRE